MLERQSKSEKFTDKLIKGDKQVKGDSSTDQIKSEKISDKSGKADKSMDKGSSESVSTLKTEPVQEPEKKSVKKKLSETIFCLVSVPLSQSSAKSRDQNNNEEKESDSPLIPPPPPPSSSSENSNTLGSLPNQSLKSTSTTSTDLELQALTLGSGSSSIATRRAHRRRNSRSRIIKPNPHDELRRYSGAWPGDQYRDQETQTSPEPTKSNANPGLTNTEAQDAPAAPEVTAPAETTSVAPGAAPGAAPGVIGALSAPPAPSVPSVPPTPAVPPASGAPDPSTPYGYPMKGQKSLKLSSNSAFSRTGTFTKSTGSHRPPLHPPPHPPPPPPNQPPSQPPPPPPTQPPAQSPPSDPTEEAKSATGPNPEGFGQFLLKPVSRLPWDAIEDLETINKEAQDQAGKRPSVDQCIEDLNEAYKDILELSTASNNLPNRSSMQIPDRIKSRGVLCSLATGNPVGDKAGLEANPEVPADWQMQLSLAEKHIATLITGEGSEENLDESNKVKGDKDIPGSESVENEVSNILATEMKDDTANAEQKPSEVKETKTEQTETPESQQPEVTEKVKEEETSREKMETEQEKCEQKDPVTEGTEQNSDITSEEKKEPNVILRANKAAIWTHSGLDSELRPEFPPDHLPLSVLPYPNRRLSLGLDWERGGWEGESLGQGGFWSRERRSLDAERWGIGGETWGLDNDRQEGGGEKLGLGGWRGCGIDGQGTDDSDWELDGNTQEADSDTKQKTLKPEQGLGEDNSSPVSSTDKVEKDKTQDVASQGIDKGQSQGPGEGQVSSVDRRSRGLSQRIEALFTAPPGHGSEERLARMREVHSVSRMRRLSLRSSDSWDGLHGVGRWGEYGWEEECPLPGPQDSSNITKVEEKEGSAQPAVTCEPKETIDDQATLKG
ncbi:hypothetical protein cypCar_00022162 [Cyprinus carpio]|nr:hypothetical protein cypCar_00022162 [Cyprinus carpio]